MNTLKIKLIGAALFFASTTVFAEPNYYSVSNIPDASSLILRAEPNSSSPSINNIPYNAVQIETTGKRVLKEGKQWMQIMYSNSIGWVETSYLTPIHPVPAKVAAAADVQPAETTTNTPTVNYTFEKVAADPQPAPENIPWTPAEDTIYHNPNPSQTIHSEKVQATHTLVITNNNQSDGDYRGENFEGSRYESVRASLSVQYQP